MSDTSPSESFSVDERDLEPSTTDRDMAGLNPDQLDAVVHRDGPLLVVAGAGSGKTRVLTHRIAHLIHEGTHPGRILAITFTNKAAAEMRERVGSLVGPVVKTMWVSTFHSACVRILRADGDRLGYPRQFSIYDQADSVRLTGYVIRDLGLDAKRFTPRGVHALISLKKNELVSPDEAAATAANIFDRKHADVFREYQSRLERAGAMDFDDLLTNVVRLFREHPDVLERYRERFEHILVDEYQDTNQAQNEIVLLLAGGHQNVCVVGDTDQCLVAGTGIATPDGRVRIEDVRERDWVLGCVGANDLVPCRVTRSVSRHATGRLGDRVLSVRTTSTSFDATEAHMIPARHASITDPPAVGLTMFADGTRHVVQSGSERSRSFSDFVAARDHGKSVAAHLGDDLVEAISIAGVDYRFVPVGELPVGARVLVDVDGVLVEEPVVSVELIEPRAAHDGRVYDLEVDVAHTYIANGVLVHNSVYKFRGADFRNILQFEDAFPDVTTIVLDQNYRSTQTILDAANAVIANNLERKPKSLWTDSGRGDRIIRYHAEDEGDEATWVAGTATQLHADDAVNWREVAVLYRTNAQSRVIEEAFMRLGVPYKVVGGTRFYDRREVKDAMAYLRAVVNPVDEVSVKRVLNVPKRGVGDASIAKLDAFAAADAIPFVDAMRRADEAGVTGPAVRGIAAFVRLLDRLGELAGTDGVGPGDLLQTATRGIGVSGRARGRGHGRGPRTHREPRRARRLRPRVHRARGVPRAGVARRRHRRPRRRRPGRADDAALGEGSRVPRRVPRRRRGRHLPAHPRADGA